MSALDLLILDLDGTLVDSFADIRRGVRVAFAHIGVEPTEDLMELCRLGVGLEVFYERALDVDAYADDQRERCSAFIEAYQVAYDESPHEARAYDGVAETLAEIRSRHPQLAIAVATAKRTKMAETVVEGAGLRPLIDAVVGCDELPHKPDPAVLRRAAQRAGRPLTGAMMVGDTDRDVGAARAAGCIACAVTYGGWTRDELLALAPDHLLDRFPDLLDVLSRS